MGINHLAFASRDLAATHRFYTEAMGFRLAKVVASPTPEGGWARHVFYDTGGGSRQLIAFWELHIPTIEGSYKTDLSKSLGLPAWVNHVAFDAPTLEDLDSCRERWQRYGLHVAHVDHGWCQSIYAMDPNRILVEFCCTTRELDIDDARAAERLLLAGAPPLDPVPPTTMYEPLAAV